MHATAIRRPRYWIDALLLLVLIALAVAAVACSAVPPYASLGITWTTLPPGARGPEPTPAPAHP